MCPLQPLLLDAVTVVGFDTAPAAGLNVGVAAVGLPPPAMIP